jgi:hypothetical protein
MLSSSFDWRSPVLVLKKLTLDLWKIAARCFLTGACWQPYLSGGYEQEF